MAELPCKTTRFFNAMATPLSLSPFISHGKASLYHETNPRRLCDRRHVKPYNALERPSRVCVSVSPRTHRVRSVLVSGRLAKDRAERGEPGAKGVGLLQHGHAPGSQFVEKHRHRQVGLRRGLGDIQRPVLTLPV